MSVEQVLHARQIDHLQQAIAQKTEKALRPTCIEWTRNIDKNGYGRWGRKGLAHRISWELNHGAIPKDLCVLHKCDNKRCHNYKHLFLGTRADNLRDAVEKGRLNNRGEKNGQAILSAEDVIAIRTSSASIKELSEEFSISRSHISRIRNRIRWASIL